MGLCDRLSAFLLDGGDRERLLDMDKRLQSLRRLAFAILGSALLVSGPWVGWWTVFPLAGAAVGFALMARGMHTSRRPELRAAGAWLLSQIAIAVSIGLTGGPESPALTWLVLPVVTLPARFTSRGVIAGVVLTAFLMVFVTVGVDPGAVAQAPQYLFGGLALLGAVALLSMALMQSDLHHRSASVIDPLTSMLNRNALATRVSELAVQAAVVREPIGVVVGDLDRFKSINDGHGHAAGDAVLRDVAYRIRKELRAFDLAYRLGGEEFLVLVPGADGAAAAAVAEALRKAVAEEPSAGLLVTMSCGVSSSAIGSFDFDAVLADADAALYRAKRSGRNRVEVADAPAVRLAA